MITLYDLLDSTSNNSVTAEDCLRDLEEFDSIAIIEAQDIRFEISDILVEANTFDLASMVRAESMDFRIKADSSGAKIEMDSKPKFLLAIQRFFDTIINAIKNIFNTIFNYFKEKTIVKQIAFLKANSSIIDEWFKVGNMNIQTNLLQFKKGVTIDMIYSDFKQLHPLAEDICEAIDAEVKKIETDSRITAASASGVFSKESSHIDELKRSFKHVIAPGYNPDLISDGESAKVLKDKYFGGNLKRELQNINDVLTSKEIYDDITNVMMFKNFEDLQKKVFKTVTTSDKNLKSLINAVYNGDAGFANSQILAVRLQNYRSLMTLIVNYLSTYWSIFLIIRNELVRAGVVIIQAMKS